tara:strand:- start:367 stop:591 length:225 start_codon:yes stop_codon:yes gene_type:complete
MGAGKGLQTTGIDGAYNRIIRYIFLFRKTNLIDMMLGELANANSGMLHNISFCWLVILCQEFEQRTLTRTVASN